MRLKSLKVYVQVLHAADIRGRELSEKAFGAQVLDQGSVVLCMLQFAASVLRIPRGEALASAACQWSCSAKRDAESSKHSGHDDASAGLESQAFVEHCDRW